MKIFSLYMKIAELDIRSFVNQVLYYYRKIPILKWLAPGSSYRMTEPKKFLTFFAPLGTVVVRFVKSIPFYGLLALISLILSNIFGRMHIATIFLNLLITAIVLDFSQFYYDTMKEKTLIHYNLFKVDPKDLTFSGIFIQEFVNIFGRFLSLVLIGKIIGIGPITLLSISFLTYLSSIIFNGLNFFLFEKSILNPENYGKYQFIATIVPLIAMAVILVLGIDLTRYLMTPLGFFIPIVLSIMSILYLRKLSRFTEILLLFEDLYTQKGISSTTEVTKSISELKTEDLELSKSHIKEGLNGYHLLNETFFQRHRRILLKPILVKTVILVIILIFFGTFGFWLNFFNLGENLPFQDMEFAKKIIAILPGIIPFASYIIFFQESMTKTMFINCDQALMQYGFYRRPKDLLKMFSLRIKKLLFWNGLPLLVSWVWLGAMKLIFNIETADILIIAMQIASLWVFFSVHTLFIYYIFQPYNDEFELRHPIYQVINGIVYFISYLSMNMRWQGSWVAPVFIAVAVIYSVIALILVYRLAPKTFKVRINK